MIRPFALGLALVLPISLHAAEPAEIKLWPGKAPGETKDFGPEVVTPPKDANDVKRVTNVGEPTIAVFKLAKAKANGCAVIVAPGGGYSILAIEHEGTQTCEWLNSLGVTAILLKYRVPKRAMQMPDNLAAIQDAQRAISFTRANAKEWGIDPNRVGMLGFSAGGNLTAWAALAEKRMYEPVDDTDKISAKPNFAMLIYPAYLVDKEGNLKPEYKTTKESPPMFFAHANDDPVTPLSSAMLYASLKKSGVPAELHIFASGGHGFGMKKSANPVSAWPQRAADWLKSRGYLATK
ncbi:MAG TPA: alpha/beta hydrolase, partial [Urbifossiella sp.]